MNHLEEARISGELDPKEQARILGRVYLYILSLNVSDESAKTEPAAEDLGRLEAAGSVGDAPVHYPDAPSFYHPNPQFDHEDHCNEMKEVLQ